MHDLYSRPITRSISCAIPALVPVLHQVMPKMNWTLCNLYWRRFFLSSTSANTVLACELALVHSDDRCGCIAVACACWIREGLYVPITVGGIRWIGLQNSLDFWFLIDSNSILLNKWTLQVTLWWMWCCGVCTICMLHIAELQCGWFNFASSCSWLSSLFG